MLARARSHYLLPAGFFRQIKANHQVPCGTLVGQPLQGSWVELRPFGDDLLARLRQFGFIGSGNGLREFRVESMLSTSDLKSAVCDAVDAMRTELIDISRSIHASGATDPARIHTFIAFYESTLHDSFPGPLIPRQVGESTKGIAGLRLQTC